MRRALLVIALLLVVLFGAGFAILLKTQSSVAAWLPVQACNYTDGLPNGIQAPEIPSKQRTAIPAPQAAELASYAVPSKMRTPELYVVAPRGWHCATIFGADGSIGITITPRTRSATGFSPPNAPVIAAAIEGNGNAVYAGCNVFPGLEAEAVTDGLPCPVKSTAELASHKGDTVIVIDPSHVKGSVPGSGGQARAIGWFTYRAASQTLTSLACDLPSQQAHLCMVILKDDWRPLNRAYSARFTAS